MLTVASVNVNGIRAAYRRGMGSWLAARSPDVLALQEVRAETDHLTDLLGPGWYVAHAVSLAKGRAGVAVASRLPLVATRFGHGSTGEVSGDEASRPGEIGGEEDSGRWVEVDIALADGRVLTVASVYVHKGEAGTPRMDPKYAFLQAMSARLAALSAVADDGCLAVVAGDLNIAHRQVDLKNWRGNLASAGFLPPERAYVDRWLDELGWVDLGRALPGPGPGPYTWWSWRGRAFDNDAGWRIDYQLASPGAAGAARRVVVDKAATYAERFSDHAPVVVEYDL